MQKPSECPRQSNISYLLLSVCVVLSLLYFVLSLPEGINAALSNSLVSARSGARISAYGGSTDPGDDSGGGGDMYPVDFDGVVVNLCDTASAQVWLAYANGTAKPQAEARSVSFSQRDVGNDILFVKNFNESLNAMDVYVYMSNHTLDSTKGNVRMSVIGKGSAEDPIPGLAPNESYNVSVGFVMRNYFGGDFNVSYAIKVCGGTRTYDEFSSVAGAPAPRRASGVLGRILGGGTGYSPPACNSANYDLSITPVTSWNITISNTSDANVICSAIKKKFTLTNNATKKVTDIKVAAWNNLSGVTHFEPMIESVDLRPGESISFVAYVLVNNNTASNGSFINVSFNCQGNDVATKQISVSYTNPGTAWDGDWPVPMPVSKRSTWRGSPDGSFYRSQVAAGVKAGVLADPDAYTFSQAMESFICQNCPKAVFPFNLPDGITSNIISNVRLSVYFPGVVCISGGQATLISIYKGSSTCNPSGSSIYSYVGSNVGTTIDITLTPSDLVYTTQGSASTGCSSSWSCNGWGSSTNFDNVYLADLVGQAGHYCATGRLTLSADVGTTTTTTSLNPGWDNCNSATEVCEYQVGGGAPKKVRVYHALKEKWLDAVTCADANCPSIGTLGTGGSTYGSDQVCDRTTNDAQDGCCCITSTTTTTLFVNSNAKCMLCQTDYSNESLAQGGNASLACSDEIDNDCDASTDCFDDNCCFSDNSTGCIGSNPYCPTPEDWNSGANCINGVDDDGDGLLDCADVANCCDDDECASATYCDTYNYLAGYPVTATLNENESNVLMAGAILPNHFQKLALDAPESEKAKLRGIVRRRNLNGKYQMALLNGTATSGILYTWTHDFKTASNNLNLSKKVRVERGPSWVFACGFNPLSGTNASIYVPNWDSNCSDIYECTDKILGCPTGGSAVAASRVNTTISADFCVVSNVNCVAVENRNGSQVYGGNTVPVLSNFSVSPTSGSPSTSFTFSVNYSDADNNPPSFVKVSFHDRGKEYSMSESNASDTNYVDGKVYNYSGTFRSRSYDVKFLTSDGKHGAFSAVLGHDPDGHTIDDSFEFTTYPTMSFSAGWNFFSPPVSLTTPTMAGIGVASACDTIIEWKPVANEFQDVASISSSSYWVWCNTSATVSFAGTEVASASVAFTAPTSCDGDKCWDPKPWLSVNPGRVTDIFKSDCTESGYALALWNSSSQSFALVTSSTSGFSVMQPGAGYYVKKPNAIAPESMCNGDSTGGWQYKTYTKHDDIDDKCWDWSTRSLVDCWGD